MDKNEETISLTKCDNSILADEIVSKLANAGIASSLHDELNDPAYGAYGPNPGIEVRVLGASPEHIEGDNRKAREATAMVPQLRQSECRSVRQGKVQAV